MQRRSAHRAITPFFERNTFGHPDVAFFINVSWLKRNFSTCPLTDRMVTRASLTCNIIARPPDSTRDRAESRSRDEPRSPSHMMAFDGRILRANASPVATPRRAMFAIAKTPSFATGVAVRATRSTRARRERCVTRRRDRPRVTRRASRSRACDARRARSEGAIVSRATRDDDATKRRRATRACEGRTRGARRVRRRPRATRSGRGASGDEGSEKGWRRKARGAIGTDRERGETKGTRD